MDKYKFFGNLGFLIIKLIEKTMKIEIVEHENFDKSKVYCYGFWHQKIFLPMVCMAKQGKSITNLVSPSKDGQIIATMLERYGYTTVRGSSNKNNIRSLIQLIKKVKDGTSAGFAVDGPKGPIYELKPGIVYTAQKTGAEIVPLGGAFSKYWTLEKSWDKLNIPKPFSKAIYMIGDPIKVPKDADVEEYSVMIAEKINQLENEAKKRLNR